MKYINNKKKEDNRTSIKQYSTIVIKEGQNILYTFLVDYTSFGDIIIQINEDNSCTTYTNEYEYWEDFLTDVCGIENFTIIDKFQYNTEYEITITRK